MNTDGGLGRRSRDTRGGQPALIPASPSDALPQPHLKAFEEALVTALERSRQSRRALSLVLVEVSPADDGAVAGVLTIIRETIRDSDGVWRTEPEHLWVILADAGGPSAEPALARLRESMRGQETVKVRIGRAAAMPGTDAQQLQLIAAFDLREVT